MFSLIQVALVIASLQRNATVIKRERKWYQDSGVLQWQIWPCCFGRTSELWARKAIECCEHSEHNCSLGVFFQETMLKAVKTLKAWCVRFQREGSLCRTLCVKNVWYLGSWSWRVSCDWQETRTTEVKPLLCPNSGCWYLGTEESSGIKKRWATEVGISGFFRDSIVLCDFFFLEGVLREDVFLRTDTCCFLETTTPCCERACDALQEWMLERVCDV